jgi:dolichol-phosphate mannosyltransferase
VSEGGPTDGPATLVVIPTFNEHDTIGTVLTRVLELARDVDVLVVDDGSPDGTGALVAELARADERLHVIHRAGKQGLGSAYRRGFAWGLERGYEILVAMDGDLSHDPDALPVLLDATSTSDLALGSRYVPGGGTVNWPWHRRALSRGGNRYVQLVTGVPVSDATSGFRAYRREVLEALDVATLRSEGYSFQLETVLRAWREGFVITEVPITFVERRSGTSKISRTIVLEAIWRVLTWGLRNRSVRARHPHSVGRRDGVR